MSIFSTLFKSSKPLDFNGTTDWHCHILPGVDDGVETIDDSLAILAEYERMGIERVWLTPHIMDDVPNTVVSLKQRFSELLEQYQGHIILKLAAENMIDNLFFERLKANDVLPIGESQNVLLVETSYFNPPMNNLQKALDRIKEQGYYPLLAHPERYNYIETMADYEQLKGNGIMFQLNLLSLSGYYGKVAKDKAHKLLKLGYYDVFGTDLHSQQQLTNLQHLSLSSDLRNALRRINPSI
jgi:tyrosine-protein phosphatase YwqE